MLVASCVLFAVSSFGAPDTLPSPNDLLMKMRKAYAKIDAAQIELVVDHPAYNLKSPISISFKKPSFIRVEVTLNDGQKIRSVTDGKSSVITDFHQTPKQVPVTDSNMFGGFPVNLEVLSLVHANRELSTAKGGNMEQSKLSVREVGGVYVLKEIADSQRVTVFYEVDKKSFLIMKTTTFRQQRQRPYSTFKVNKLNLNPVFPDGYFDWPQ